MRQLLIMLLLGLPLLLPISSAGKQETFLESIQNKLQEEIKDFDPQMELLEEVEVPWTAKVNDDYLRGVVAVFNAADSIPAKPPGIPIYESKEFGFVIGVGITLLILFAVR